MRLDFLLQLWVRFPTPLAGVTVEQIQQLTRFEFRKPTVRLHHPPIFKSRQGFEPCMNDYVDPMLVGSGVHLPCYIDFRPTGTHGSHHSTCERLPIPPRDRTDARKHSRTVKLIIPHETRALQSVGSCQSCLPTHRTAPKRSIRGSRYVRGTARRFRH